MTKHDRSILDDLVEVGREVLDKIDEVLNPDRKRRQPARVPVPVRGNQRREDPYNNDNPYA